MRIIDNFLHKKDFKEIQEWILEPSCRWSYSPCVVDPNDEVDEDPAAYQFVNMIYYSRMGHENPDCARIFTLLDKLRPQVLLKAKLNMQMMTDTIRVNDKHTDFTPSITCTTAIYYINSNNGYSLIGDKKVESVENRIVLFNGKTLHTGTTCTDERRRLVLNLNFQGGPYDQTN
tara:strand:- start:290 stop:811 length:522 start_codon:yes stop_codon:yes gene_type:complete